MVNIGDRDQPGPTETMISGTGTHGHPFRGVQVPVPLGPESRSEVGPGPGDALEAGRYGRRWRTFHVVAGLRTASCGSARGLVDMSLIRPASEVDPIYRCRRNGCRQGWPTPPVVHPRKPKGEL